MNDCQMGDGRDGCQQRNPLFDKPGRKLGLPNIGVKGPGREDTLYVVMTLSQSIGVKKVEALAVLKMGDQ